MCFQHNKRTAFPLPFSIRLAAEHWRLEHDVVHAARVCENRTRVGVPMQAGNNAFAVIGGKQLEHAVIIPRQIVTLVFARMHEKRMTEYQHPLTNRHGMSQRVLQPLKLFLAECTIHIVCVFSFVVETACLRGQRVRLRRLFRCLVAPFGIIRLGLLGEAAIGAGAFDEGVYHNDAPAGRWHKGVIRAVVVVGKWGCSERRRLRLLLPVNPCPREIVELVISD
mmetsp:Transcript_14713/g.24508  ORF Transcript_14713/g.24508 Transcript_14713/m.24508 type:complete len:223 (-) Transcript_14713:621-1289(-)